MSPDVDGLAGRLMKLQLRNDLGNEEEEHNINSQKFAEIDLGRIQKETVANQHKGTRYEPSNLLRSGRVIKARLKASVALHLKIGGQNQDDENANRG